MTGLLVEFIRRRAYWYRLWTGMSPGSKLSSLFCVTYRRIIDRAFESTCPSNTGTYMLAWWEQIVFSKCHESGVYNSAVYRVTGIPRLNKVTFPMFIPNGLLPCDNFLF